jgi:hypothetical protein
VNGKLTWKKEVGSGFVASRNGLILTSYSLVDRTDLRGPMVRQITGAYWVQWVTIEFWGSQGQYSKVKGFVYGEDGSWGGYTLIAVDPHKVHLTPIPLGDAGAARVGEPVVLLYHGGYTALSATQHLSAVWHDAQEGSNGTKNRFQLLR